MEYTTPHTPHMNGVREIIFSVIKEAELEILLNKKLKNTDQKILWKESVHTRERIINSMTTTGNTKSPFKTFYGEKTKIIGLFLEFGNIGYVTKRYKFKKKIVDKTFKAIMAGYS